jgi:hypothetical protein
VDKKGITRRLDALQQIADRNRPCKIVVTFTDGRSITTSPLIALELFRQHGPFEDIVGFASDRQEYDGLCGALSVLCHPVPNRRIEDFE